MEVTKKTINFNKPRNVRIGDVDYSDIRLCNATFIRSPEKKETLYNMRTRGAEYSVSTINGKLSTSKKYYDIPVSRTFDGVTYKNILSNELLPNGNKVYSIYSKYALTPVKNIIVSPDNHVLNKKSSLLEVLGKQMHNVRKYLNLL